MRKARADALKLDDEDALHHDEQMRMTLQFGWDVSRPILLQSSAILCKV